jgi:hypothetical protein
MPVDGTDAFNHIGTTDFFSECEWSLFGTCPHRFVNNVLCHILGAVRTAYRFGIISVSNGSGKSFFFFGGWDRWTNFNRPQEASHRLAGAAWVIRGNNEL